MTASVTRGRALRYAGGSARGLLHHVLGHCLGIAASAAMFGDPVSGMFAEGALLVVGGIGFSVLADRT